MNSGRVLLGACLAIALAAGCSGASDTGDLIRGEGGGSGSGVQGGSGVASGATSGGPGAPGHSGSVAGGGGASTGGSTGMASGSSGGPDGGPDGGSGGTAVSTSGGSTGVGNPGGSGASSGAPLGAPDAADLDAAAPEATTVTGTGMISCGGVTACTAPEVCCQTRPGGGGVFTCAADPSACPAGSNVLACRSAANCVGGAVCCETVSLPEGGTGLGGLWGRPVRSASCSSSCAGVGTRQVCAIDSECLGSGTCRGGTCVPAGGAGRTVVDASVE